MMSTGLHSRPLAALAGALVGLDSNAAVVNVPHRPSHHFDGDAFEPPFSKAFRAYQRRMRPHAAPMFVAICRSVNGSRYHHCATRDQALAHGPYLIEHVNGFGQITHRERFR